MHKNVLKFAYNVFNNMGNEIEYQDVASYLLKGTQLFGRNKKELMTLSNSAKALEYVTEEAFNGREVTKELVLDIHRVLMDGISSTCGVYRKHNVKQYACGVHNYKDIDRSLDQFIDFYNKIKICNSASYLAAFAHAEIIRIHPFNDGNGRVALLLTNFILIKHNLPVISIEAADRELYYYFTDLYTKRHVIQPMVDLIEMYTRGGGNRVC